MNTQKGSQQALSLRFPGKRGQTLVEYALIIAFISVVAIAALISMGTQVQAAYTTVDSQMTMAEKGGVSGGRH